jgi:transposase
MEEVLEVYKRPYNEAYPVICMDEKPLQLLGDQRPPQPMTTTHNRREDSEYVRCGTCSIFMFNEPLGGTRYVSAQEHRTKKDWAIEIHSLLTKHYPHAEKVVLVMDNLNTHTIASLYETFPAKEALEMAQRLEVHFTPKHGSWLNMAEIELSALTSQCLNRRIDNLPKLRKEIRAWQRDRNRNRKTIKWQFTTADARIQLHSLYPVI